MNVPGAPGQNNWRWCNKCQGLAFAGTFDMKTAGPLIMADITAQLHATTTPQPVATSSMDISFEHCIVTLTRPWWPEVFLMVRNWFVPGYPRAAFSNAKGDGDPGLLPVLASGFVAIRNLKISTQWSGDDLTAMQKSASFGPFSLIGREFNAGTGTLSCPAIQIIGWFCEALPILPPASDPATPEPQVTLPSSAPVVAGTTSEPAPSTQPDVLSSGRVLLKGTYVFDFDKGILDPGGDLWWEQKDGIARFLVPRNGAMAASLGGAGFEALNSQNLSEQHYSTTPINGSNDATNLLLPGTIIGIKTKSGHYAKMCINSYGYDLDIKWVTYK
jgi:hypothetical protein